MSDFFAPLAVKVLSGLSLALAIALGLALWRADSLAGQRDDALREVGAIGVRLEASNASVAVLTAEMDKLVEEGRIREERKREALQAAAEAGAAMLEEARAGEGVRTDWRGVEGL